MTGHRQCLGCALLMLCGYGVQFYTCAFEDTLGPLVKYMNRMPLVMKMLADRRNNKASTQGSTVKDFIWTLQHQLPEEASKLSLESYIFGVLQVSVSGQMLLERLRKLTPDEHVSMPKCGCEDFVGSPVAG